MMLIPGTIYIAHCADNDWYDGIYAMGPVPGYLDKHGKPDRRMTDTIIHGEHVLFIRYDVLTACPYFKNEYINERVAVVLTRGNLRWMYTNMLLPADSTIRQCPGLEMNDTTCKT